MSRLARAELALDTAPPSARKATHTVDRAARPPQRRRPRRPAAIANTVSTRASCSRCRGPSGLPSEPGDDGAVPRSTAVLEPLLGIGGIIERGFGARDEPSLRGTGRLAPICREAAGRRRRRPVAPGPRAPCARFPRPIGRRPPSALAVVNGHWFLPRPPSGCPRLRPPTRRSRPPPRPRPPRRARRAG